MLQYIGYDLVRKYERIQHSLFDFDIEHDQGHIDHFLFEKILLFVKTNKLS